MLLDAALACLEADTADQKVLLTFATAAAFFRGELALAEDAPAPQAIRMPGRPPSPALVHPRDLPRRGFGTPQAGRFPLDRSTSNQSSELAGTRSIASVACRPV